MTDLQAAVGLVQLGRLAEIVARRRELAARYAQALAELAGPARGRRPRVGHDQLPVVLGRGRPDVSRSTATSCWPHLAAAGISARRGIMAAHRQPAYAGRDRHAPLPVTERLTDHSLILPLFHQMTEAEQARVIDVLRDGWRRA